MNVMNVSGYFLTRFKVYSTGETYLVSKSGQKPTIRGLIEVNLLILLD